MIGIAENKITRVPLVDAVKMVCLFTFIQQRLTLIFIVQTNEVTQAIKDKDFDKAMSLRDPEFRESLDGFYATSILEKEPRLPHSQRMRIAFMQYVLT